MRLFHVIQGVEHALFAGFAESHGLLEIVLLAGHPLSQVHDGVFRGQLHRLHGSVDFGLLVPPLFHQRVESLHQLRQLFLSRQQTFGQQFLLQGLSLLGGRPPLLLVPLDNPGICLANPGADLIGQLIAHVGREIRGPQNLIQQLLQILENGLGVGCHAFPGLVQPHADILRYSLDDYRLVLEDLGNQAGRRGIIGRGRGSTQDQIGLFLGSRWVGRCVGARVGGRLFAGLLGNLGDAGQDIASRLVLRIAPDRLFRNPLCRRDIIHLQGLLGKFRQVVRANLKLLGQLPQQGGAWDGGGDPPTRTDGLDELHEEGVVRARLRGGQRPGQARVAKSSLDLQGLRRLQRAHDHGVAVSAKRGERFRKHVTHRTGPSHGSRPGDGSGNPGCQLGGHRIGGRVFGVPQ